MIKAKTVDEYISSFPEPVQKKLRTLRKTIRAAVPEAEESISYQMPYYKYHGRLVYFAAFKEHYSLFPTDSPGMWKRFEKELSRYEGKKGTIRFPMDKPVPVKLIREITVYRAKENLSREKGKK